MGDFGSFVLGSIMGCMFTGILFANFAISNSEIKTGRDIFIDNNVYRCSVVYKGKVK